MQSSVVLSRADGMFPRHFAQAPVTALEEGLESDVCICCKGRRSVAPWNMVTYPSLLDVAVGVPNTVEKPIRVVNFGKCKYTLTAVMYSNDLELGNSAAQDRSKTRHFFGHAYFKGAFLFNDGLDSYTRHTLAEYQAAKHAIARVWYQKTSDGFAIDAIFENGVDK
ncbi:hypothetical protein K470DRAFT_273269 [Piedraia hortae CBS 480.64]|uniref:Uncharacterized protein n=1 Tax=Piedraia hortae CBS 480.64 TaxID=1314780 RepID=A0A6A7BQR3_9PEZI|nr:hypothetical protein K470DRAFT_273269 [Piedraia hortae CBS 480.64]